MTEQTNKLLNIGYGNFVLIDKILSIMTADSLPMKRLKDEAKERSQLVDATQGRKTRSIIICNTNHVFLSALSTDTLNARFHGKAETNEGDEAA